MSRICLFSHTLAGAWAGGTEYGVNFVLPGGTVGYPARPTLIRLSVRLSVISLLIILQKIAQAQQIW